MTKTRDDAANKVDALKLDLLLTELRLPTMKDIWRSFSERANAEGWPAARFLTALAEHELAERARGRIQRHLNEAKLLPGKSLANFDFNVVPTISKAQVMALAAGDAWLDQGRLLFDFWPARCGKIAPCLGNRAGPGGKWVPGALYPHHRPGAAAAGGPAGPDAGEPAGETGPLSPRDPR